MAGKTKKTRVCWLLNHTTLMDSEVPLLIDLGFEVFVPKRVNATMECRTATVDYQYDRTLTVAKPELDRLNSFNFYQPEWSDDILELLNKNFDVAIVPFIMPTAYHMVRYFRGKTFLRVFGVAGDMNYEMLAKYGDEVIAKIKATRPKKNFLREKIVSLFWHLRMKNSLDVPSILASEILRNREHVWLAASYQEIIDHEGPLFHSHSVYLPLGLGESLSGLEGTWRGELDKIFFVCPNVNQNEYYRQIYRSFVQRFGHLPYSIGGRQDLGEASLDNSIEDAAILGFQERPVYNSTITQHKLMYYHSREPRHLHYHPLEAILFGQPLLFLEGGLLCSLGGKGLPGMCRDEDEAVAKATRILQGDKQLIDSIRVSQKSILEQFRMTNVKSHWERKFLSLV